MLAELVLLGTVTVVVVGTYRSRSGGSEGDLLGRLTGRGDGRARDPEDAERRERRVGGLWERPPDEPDPTLPRRYIDAQKRVFGRLYNPSFDGVYLLGYIALGLGTLGLIGVIPSGGIWLSVSGGLWVAFLTYLTYLQDSRWRADTPRERSRHGHRDTERP